ncbi:uncharacterized protein [Dermacentor andersoni]|uniref:uncharacterized protein isoform X2 n=1 Tax=Dermacentor andersoni TaxID=34620 RepID=UPI00241765D0|nr:uncharacterized protein LOC126540575 isoform X2 [Dermacentor andersoni]
MPPGDRAARWNEKRRLRRATETDEEREERLAKQRAQYAARRQRSITGEESASTSLASESDSTSTSSERWNATKRMRRARETSEERLQRLEKERPIRERQNEKRRKRRAEEAGSRLQFSEAVAEERRAEHATRVGEFESATPSQAGAFRYQSADESKAKKHHARAVQAKPRVRPIGFLFAVRHRYTNRPFVVQIRKSEEMSPGLCDGSLRLMILNDGFTSRSTADDLELPNSCQLDWQAGGSLCPPSRSTLCNSHCAKETKMRMSLHQVKGSFRGASYFTCWPAVGQPGMAKKRKLRQPCNKASVLHKSLELFFVYPNVWIITRLGQIHSRKLLLAKATPHFLSHVSRHIDFSILADNFLWQRRE